MMRILVLGATGFLGQHLVRAAIAKGHETIALVRRIDHGLTCPTVVLDPFDVEGFGRVVRENHISVVINLLAAGVDPSDRDEHRLLTANAFLPPQLVTEAAKAGAMAFVHVGSSAEYAPLTEPRPLLENDPAETERLYGATKAAGSILSLATARSAGISAVVMRAFNIFGHGEKEYRLFPSLASKLARNEPVALSEGFQVRDFLFVDDACDALLRMADKLEKGVVPSGCYNLGSGHPTAVRDFVRMIASLIGADETLLQFGALPTRPDDLPYVVASISRLKDAIGPASRGSLEEAMARAVRNFNVRKAS